MSRKPEPREGAVTTKTSDVKVTPRHLLAAGAIVTVLGIAIAGTAPVLGTDGSSRTVGQQIAGGVVVVLGWAILAWAIHRFGRDPS